MKTAITANIVILVALLVYSVNRDLRYQKEGAGDLRNRVVGARLMKAGRDPYFYKWKKGDSYRYLDYTNVNADSVSAITATPFFHRLIFTLAEYPQKAIVYTWFILEYIALIVIIVAGIFICNTPSQKLIALNAGILFTYTHAWQLHMVEGQLYIFVAAVLMLIALLIIRFRPSNNAFIFAAILTVALILIRPIAGVVLVPFVLHLRKYNTYLIATFLFATAYAAFALTNGNERRQWMAYRAGMQYQIVSHQNLPHSFIKVDTPPVLNSLEGLDLYEQRKKALEDPFPNHSENGNVFFVYNTLTKSHMGVAAIYVSYVCTVLLLILLFICMKASPTDRSLVLFAFILYMVTELFTPVHRHQYNSVQWLPLVLLSIPINSRLISIGCLLVFAGIVLNISNTPLIPMRHTIGEYLLLTGLLLAVFKNKPAT